MNGILVIVLWTVLSIVSIAMILVIGLCATKRKMKRGCKCGGKYRHACSCLSISKFGKCFTCDKCKDSFWTPFISNWAWED